MAATPVNEKMRGPASVYALGYSESEHERLIRQAALIAPITERLFREAGIGPGQHVLDLGSGMGDVFMLAALPVRPRSGRPLMAVRAAVLKYLRTIGIRRDAKVFPSMLYGSITIELYDLTDPAHLADASSENFPVPPMPRDPKIGCRDWTKPDYDWNFLR